MTQLPRRRRRLLAVLVLVLAALVTGCAAQADPGRVSGTLVTQGRHVVEQGQVLVGSTAVVGGTVVLEEGAQHRGPLTVLAGEVRVDGLVTGDVTILGGDVVLADSAEVAGDVVVAGGGLSRGSGAVVHGTLTEGPDAGVVLAAGDPARSAVERVLWSLAWVLAMAALAWLAARLAPGPVSRTQAAATGYPVVSGALGVLVMLTLLPLVASMVFTLFLIPVAVAVVIGMGLAAAHGLLALGRGLGVRLLDLLGHHHWPAARTAALGTAVLAGGLQVAALVPLLGAVLVLLVLAVGLGAVFLTGFGLRAYTPPDEEEAAARTGGAGT